MYCPVIVLSVFASFISISAMIGGGLRRFCVCVCDVPASGLMLLRVSNLFCVGMGCIPAGDLGLTALLS